MAKSQHQSPVCLYVLFAVLFIWYGLDMIIKRSQYILIRKVQKVDPIPTKFRVPVRLYYIMKCLLIGGSRETQF